MLKHFFGVILMTKFVLWRDVWMIHYGENKSESRKPVKKLYIRIPSLTTNDTDLNITVRLKRSGQNYESLRRQNPYNLGIKTVILRKGCDVE